LSRRAKTVNSFKSIKTLKTGSIELKEGARFVFTTEDVEGDETKVSVSFDSLVRDLNVGDRILVEDKSYMLDKKIEDYTGESEEHEYYHITDSYFPVKEIARELAEDLEEKGVARLRTDYALNDNDFYDITDEIYDILGEDIDLYGYHWLGVIYLELR